MLSDAIAPTCVETSSVRNITLCPCLKTLGNDCVHPRYSSQRASSTEVAEDRIVAPALLNAQGEILARKTEMEADDLRMKLHHEIAHFVVEGSAGGFWNGSIAISLQLDAIGIQPLCPVHFPSAVVSRRLVTEEVCIDWVRGSSADGFQLLACMLRTQ